MEGRPEAAMTYVALFGQTSKQPNSRKTHTNHVQMFNERLKERRFGQRDFWAMNYPNEFWDPVWFVCVGVNTVIEPEPRFIWRGGFGLVTNELWFIFGMNITRPQPAKTSEELHIFGLNQLP